MITTKEGGQDPKVEEDLSLESVGKRAEEPKVHISTVRTAEPNRRSGRDSRGIDLWIRQVEEINGLMDEDSDGSGIKNRTCAMRGMVEA
ncbi:unnamed protein product [Cochlearia groenlandica]